jgi:stage V sporulation protein AC
MNKEEYKSYVEKRAKKSPLLKNTIIAFMVGGFICVIGQVFKDLYIRLGAEKNDASTFASITIIFIAITLTGFGVFDSLAKHAGAGMAVPISGFANSVSAEAIDAKSEGYVLGVGAKIFTIAGPVILYGTLSGVAYGLIYYLVGVIN